MLRSLRSLLRLPSPPTHRHSTAAAAATRRHAPLSSFSHSLSHSARFSSRCAAAPRLTIEGDLPENKEAMREALALIRRLTGFTDHRLDPSMLRWAIALERHYPSLSRELLRASVSWHYRKHYPHLGSEEVADLVAATASADNLGRASILAGLHRAFRPAGLPDPELENYIKKVESEGDDEEGLTMAHFIEIIREFVDDLFKIKGDEIMRRMDEFMETVGADGEGATKLQTLRMAKELWDEILNMALEVSEANSGSLE